MLGGFAAAQVNLGPTNSQVKGVLQPANGGTGNATNSPTSGTSLPTACGPGFGPTIFYKTTDDSHYECSVPGSSGIWRKIYGAATGASGSDGYIQFASSGLFSSDARLKFDVATGVWSVGDGTTQGLIKLFDGSGHFVAFKSPTGVTSVTWLLPSSDASGCFKSDGAGNMSIGSCGSSGLADPGSNGLIKRTALNTTAAAAAADVYGLFSGTCNSTTYLRGDGSCNTPAGGASVPDWVSSSPDLTPGSPNALDDEFTGAALSGSWTQTNDTGVTFTVGQSYLAFQGTTAGGDSVRQLWKTTPSTPYEFEVKVMGAVGNANNFNWTGICLGDGTKITAFAIDYRGNVPQSELSVINWNSQTSFNAYASNFVGWGGSGTAYGPYWNRWLYLKVKNDGTNLIFNASMTGTDGSWTQVFSVAKTSFLGTIDRVGPCQNSNATANPTMGIYDFFRRVL
jgi:hypothetical protein